MKKGIIKYYIFSTIYFVLLFVLKLTSVTYSKNLAKTLDYSFYDLVMLLTCVIFVILGIIIGILANRKELSKTEKILDSVIIGLPSVLLMLTGFLFVKNLSFVPDLFKGNNVIFMFGGAAMFGGIVQTAIKTHKKHK